MATNELSKIQSYLEVQLYVERAAKCGVTIRFMPVKEGDFWTSIEEKNASGYGFDTLKAFVDGLVYQEDKSQQQQPSASA
jgi:hypothetical protein